MVFSIIEGDVQLVDKNGDSLATTSGVDGPVLEVLEQNLDSEGYIRNSAHNYGQYEGNWKPFAVDSEGRQKLVIETALSTHAINGSSHTGQLDDSQIPSYITRDEELNTVSGSLQEQIDNMSIGIVAHSSLTNLDYASSGHTGFQPTGDYATNSKVDTTSGTLQDQIDNFEGMEDHANEWHTVDFITDVELTVASGVLQDQIDNIVIPVDFYSRAEVDTISGTLQNEIDSLNEMSIHGNEYHSTAFASTTYVNTVSGTLQNQIDAIPPVISQHNYLSGLQGGTTNQYYHLNEAQYTNISGGNPVFNSITATHYGDGSYLTGISGTGGGTTIAIQDDYVDVGSFSTLNFQYLTVTDEGLGKATITHEVVFGTYCAYNSSIAESTTTSNAYQQKLRITVSGLAVGTYRLGWYCEMRGGDLGSDFLMKIEQNDTTVLAETNIEPKDSTGYVPESGFAYVDLLSNTAYNFDMDYRSETSGQTTYIRRARFEFWRII